MKAARPIDRRARGQREGEGGWGLPCHGRIDAPACLPSFLASLVFCLHGEVVDAFEPSFTIDPKMTFLLKMTVDAPPYDY